MMSEVTEALQALAGGQASLDDVALKFRNRAWPVREAREPGQWPDGDPEPDPEGGFGEVEAAFASGLITKDQYAALAVAAAEAIKNQAGGESQTKAGGPPLSAGSFVKWSGGQGRVDLVVKNGTVPGVDGDVSGTADSPAARVTVWEDGKATSRKTGVKLSALTRIPPLAGGGESKSADAALVTVLADHEQRVADQGLPGYALPGARAVLAVYDRGVNAWPGEAKTLLNRQEWALGRVGAFLELAAGGQLEGYERDKDQLPEGHPARGGA